MKSKLPEGFHLPTGAHQDHDRTLGTVPGHIVISIRVNGDTLLEVAIAEERFEGAMEDSIRVAGEYGMTLEPPVGAVEISGMTLLEAHERGVDHEDETEKGLLVLSAMVLIDQGADHAEFLAKGAKHLALDLRARNGKGMDLQVSAGWPPDGGAPH